MSTVEAVEEMKAPLLAQRTKAENASLSWAVLRRPDAEFYIEAYIRQLKFYMEEKTCQYLNQTPRIKRDQALYETPR
jgi:hypothetical protein